MLFVLFVLLIVGVIFYFLFGGLILMVFWIIVYISEILRFCDEDGGEEGRVVKIL